MRGTVKHCVFGNCNSDNREGRPGFDLKTKFYSFPKPCLQFRKSTADVKNDKIHIIQCKVCQNCSDWVKSCKRMDRKFNNIRYITKDTYICGKHFVNNDMQRLDIDILPLESNRVHNLKLKRKRTCLEEKYVFTHNKKPCTSTQTTAEETYQVEQYNMNHNSEVLTENMPVINLEKASDCYDKNETELITENVIATNTNYENSFHCYDKDETNISKVDVGVSTELKTRSVSTQTTFTYTNIEKLQSKIRQLKDEVKTLKSALSGKDASPIKEFIQKIKINHSMCKFYTGFVYQQILTLLSFVSCNVPINYWGCKTKNNGKRAQKHTQEEEIILTLIRLRTGLLVTDISYRFEISAGLISKIFNTWIQVMYQKFNSIRHLMFPSRDKIRQTLPKSFNEFKNIRVIIDCTEIFCETPSNFEQQGNTYSSYKAHSTLKVLIGCTPNGAVSFVSDLFEGSISDREIVEKSNLMDLLQCGDLILADRGFTIRDITDSKQVILNIPAFLMGRDRLTPQEEIDTKLIAKNRIFVEHVVGRFKNDRLLRKVLPLSMRGILSQVVFVCGCLLNFEEPIIT